MNEIISELEKISENTKQTFGDLSPEQLNWKPSAESWSVAQCFEHLIKTDSLFFPEFEKIANGTRTNSFLESWSPLSGIFGKMLINTLKKDNKKFKAPSQDIVPPSEIGADIIEKFQTHIANVINKIKATENADWQKTVVTSPFMSLMTYKLGDGYQIIVEHNKRHFRQAERVLKTDGFPK